MSEQNQEPSYIFGRHPVEEILASEPKRIQKLFVKEGIEPKFLDYLKKESSANRIPIMYVDMKKIISLVGDVNHQGVMALVSEIPFIELKDWIKSVDISKNPCCVLLDELEDPHNVGAIIRTATAAGVDGIIFGKHHQAPMSPVVYKTSAGTIGKVPLIRVTNINDAILKLKESKFWIVGLDGQAKKNIWQGEFDSPTCFVIGGEGSGIREKTLEHCDFTFSIPMENGVESLNASVSAAIVLYEWRKQRLSE